MERQDGALYSFGKKLSALREERGMSVDELASRAGLDARELSMIEAGKKDIHITGIFRLAAVLGVPASQLISSL